MLMMFMPETASAPASARKRYAVRTLPLMVGFILLYVGPGVLDLGGFGQIAQMLSLVCLVFVIGEFIVLMRALDELQFKLQMIALAAAGGFVTVGATLWGMAALVFELREINSIFALPVFGLAYYACLFIVARRFS